MKRLITSILLIVAFTFNSCSWCEVEVPHYIEATCPRIETLEIVPRIEVTVGPDGNISERSIPSLIKGARRLRRSESYYYDQVTRYNIEFVDVGIDKLDE